MNNWEILPLSSVILVVAMAVAVGEGWYSLPSWLSFSLFAFLLFVLACVSFVCLSIYLYRYHLSMVSIFLPASSVC